MMRLARAAVLLGGLACALPASGCRQAAPPDEEVAIAPVKVEPAEETKFGEWTELIGATQPLPGRVARVTAPVEGHVLSILTDENGKAIAEGQRVAKSQVVVRLDDRVARAQRDRLLAMLDELGESHKQAELAYQLAVLDQDRLTKLIPGGAVDTSLQLVSRIELEKAKLAVQDAQSKQRGVNAKEKTLRAELQVLQLHLDFHNLRAPIVGVLGPIQAVPGQTLAVGAAVADVTDLSEIDVVAFAAPRAAQKLRQDQLAWFAGNDTGEVNKAGPAGKVVFIAEQAQPDTGNLLVKVRFTNQQLRLRANQVARVQVLTQPETKRFAIPESALLEDQDPPLVIVAADVKVEKKEDKEVRTGKARRLRAILGVRDRAHHDVEILRLEDPATKEAVPVPGTLFIVEGGHGLHDGDLLKFEEHKDGH